MYILTVLSGAILEPVLNWLDFLSSVDRLHYCTVCNAGNSGILHAFASIVPWSRLWIRGYMGPIPMNKSVLVWNNRMLSLVRTWNCFLGPCGVNCWSCTACALCPFRHIMLQLWLSLVPPPLCISAVTGVETTTYSCPSFSLSFVAFRGAAMPGFAPSLPLTWPSA